MNSVFEDPEQGIKVIDVAIGHLADQSTDCLLHIRRLKKIRKILNGVKDGFGFDDSDMKELQWLYNSILLRASQKVRLHVWNFEEESRLPDPREYFREEEDNDSP